MEQNLKTGVSSPEPGPFSDCHTIACNFSPPNPTYQKPSKLWILEAKNADFGWPIHASSISMHFFLVMLLCMESVRTNQMVTDGASRTLLGSRFIYWDSSVKDSNMAY